MYNYRRVSTAGFDLYFAQTKAGDVHYQMPTEDGITTLTKNSANLYLKGEYRTTDATGLNVLHKAGECSLDCNILFKKGVLVTETAETDGLRVCMSSAGGKLWTRRVAEADFDAKKGELLIPLQGQITINGQSFGVGNLVVPTGDRQVAVSGRVFVCAIVEM